MDLMLLIAACVPGIEPHTLAAVVAHESAGNPNAVNLNSRRARISRVPKTRAEARHVLSLLADGSHGSYDIGLGQINSTHLGRLGLTAHALLDPCLNLQVAARILGECFGHGKGAARTGQERLADALSCYNTGNRQRGFTNGYVQSVYRQASRPIALDVAMSDSLATMVFPSPGALAAQPGVTSPAAYKVSQ